MGQGAPIALSDLSLVLSVLDDACNETQRLLEAKIDPIGEGGQDGAGDGGVAPYVTHEQPEVRTFVEEGDGVIDQHVKLVEGVTAASAAARMMGRSSSPRRVSVSESRCCLFSKKR